MRILLDIGHPAHVHYFKNAIRELEARGHSIKITARDREFTKQLLTANGLEFTITDRYRRGLPGKVIGLIKNDLAIYKIARGYKPDLFLSFGSPYAAHVSRLVGKKHIAFTDTEHARLISALTYPFTDSICTPACYLRKLDPKKHLRFNGYMELAYLHPRRFTPDASVMENIGLSRDERYFVVRFVSWGASHDIGEEGISLENKIILVDELKKHGKVFITSEGLLPPELETYRLKLHPHLIHHLLAYATLYVGESPTMTTESAILGTPAVCINSWACDCGNFQDLKRYGLIGCYRPRDFIKAVEYVKELLGNPNLKAEWEAKRQKMLDEKIDVTDWIVNSVERGE